MPMECGQEKPTFLDILFTNDDCGKGRFIGDLIDQAFNAR
jgi:hypothetical protein